MAITINGTPWDNGRPLTVNGTQVGSVTVNGVEVWKDQPTFILTGEAKSPLLSDPNVWTALSTENGGIKVSSSGYPDSPICYIDENGNLTDGEYRIPDAGMAHQGFAINNNVFTAVQDSSTTIGEVIYDPITGLFSGSTRVEDQFGQELAITTAREGQLYFKAREVNSEESETSVYTTQV